MKFLIAIGLMITSLMVASQSNSIQWDDLDDQEQQVMQVIVEIFDGMRAGDSSVVKSHFYPQPSANTAFTTEAGSRELRTDDINNWFNAIGKPHEQVWDERIWNYEVRIDGNLASVWVRYAFYLDDEFSHCGVDAFHLAHDGQRWRIFHLADTRQSQNCDVPDHIKKGAIY